MFDHFYRNEPDEHAAKKVKRDPQIAIIPPGVQWPPCAAKPTRNQDCPQNHTPLKPKIVKVPRNLKHYRNARYNEFVTSKKSMGFCTCNCTRRTYTFKEFQLIVVLL